MSHESFTDRLQIAFTPLSHFSCPTKASVICFFAEARAGEREMSNFIQVNTTIDTQEGAKKIADTLIERRLAACVQISGPITSTYWWQGQIEVAQEWLCTAKTRQDLYAAVEQAIREVHAYEEPEILVTPVLTGSQGYLNWIAQETTEH
jgi:periplasmic divalent cation tolerance protein